MSTWSREDAEGETRWIGRYSVFNKHTAFRAILMRWVIGTPFLMFVGGPMLLGRGAGDFFWFVGGLSILFISLPCGLARLLTVRGEVNDDEFISPLWTLRSLDGELVYARADAVDYPGDKWAVRLDEVARVEVDKTENWETGRQTAEGWLPTSPFEYQVFLSMRNGSLRVITRVNADRQACSTLAASIRDWLDAKRAKPLAVLRPLARAEGFDI